MWSTSGGYYTPAAYAPAPHSAFTTPQYAPQASPRAFPNQYAAAAMPEQPRTNPNCAGNDVGACIGRCHLCAGSCLRHGHKCMACVGGCQDLDRAGYTLGHPLCEGRYGFVRTATKDGKTFAMKVIPIDKFTKSEIELQTLLPDHPHIVQIYEAFKTENVIILVLEFCQHGDLFEYMQKRREEFKGKPMAEDQVRNFFLQILSPVRDLHQLHVAHHDIKLENYLLTNGKMGTWTLKLADFGAAERLERTSITSCRKGHISPEKKMFIETGRPYCAYKSDLYQLGSALHEVAFEMREPRPDGSINPPDRHVPSPELQDLLRHLLVLDSNQRISMDEVLRHPWVTKDRALFEHVIHKAPLPPASSRPSCTPSSSAPAPWAKHEPMPTPVPQPQPHPPSVKANGIPMNRVPTVPRLPLNSSLNRSSTGSDDKGYNKGSRIVVTPRKVESPRPGAPISARSSHGGLTPRTGSASRPSTASGTVRPATEPAIHAPATSLRPQSGGGFSGRMTSSAAAYTALAAPPAAIPAQAPTPSYTYSQGYPTAPNGNYGGGYSNLVPNQYYTSTTPTSYMAASGVYQPREPTLSPRYYTGSAVPSSPYGTSSYILHSDMSSLATQAYKDPSVFASSHTPRQYYA